MDYIYSVNPATEEVFGKSKVSSKEDVENAVRLAREAFQEWSEQNIKERKAIIWNAAEIFRREKQRLGALITKEMGKPVDEAISEAEGAGDELDYYADTVEKAIKPRIEKHEKGRVIIRSEPIGVIGAISPWNYPISTAISAIGPALLVGNTVVFKPSELTTLTGIELVKIFEEAGLPEGALNIIIGKDDVGKMLVKSEIDMVAFTGSREAGKNIMRNSSDKLHILCLELGGKDPFIVDKDADLTLTAEEAVDSAFGNCGQICCSVERVYVVRDLYQEFVNKVLEKAKEIKVSDGFDKNTDMGPLASKQQFENFISHISDAKEKGARILFGGKRMGTKGFFYEPTVIVDVNEDMKIMREETFGPVMPIQAVNNVEEAIKLANKSRFGLTVSVWTKNKKMFEEYAKRLEAGTVGINRHGYISHIFPWGGWKESGFGRIGSIEGIKQFTQTKTIYLRK